MRFTTPFILASASPRRSRLLSRIGVEFEVHVSNADEIRPPGVGPADIAQHLALRKAVDVASRYPDSLTLGADTIVVIGEDILGKPESDADAREMLRRLSGRTHVVHTGIALVHPASSRSVARSEATRVTFAEMESIEIAAYVATGSPMDKAGAYGIQDDRGALFVRRIEGDYYNVVGLPLHLLYQTIKTCFPDLLQPNHLV